MALCKKGVARAKVRAINGKPSILYNDLLKIVGNRDVALDVYAKYNSDNFSKIVEGMNFDTDVNNEANAEFVIEVLENNHNLKIDVETNQASDESLSTENTDDRYGELKFTPSDDLNVTFDDDGTFDDDSNEEYSESEEDEEILNNLIEDQKEFNKNFKEATSEYQAEGNLEDDTNFITTEDADALRRSNYINSLKSINQKISDKESAINGRIRVLSKDKEANREEIKELKREVIDLNKQFSKNQSDIANVNSTFETKAMVVNIMSKLNRIYSSLKNDKLNGGQLANMGFELKIWLDAYNALAIEEDSAAIKANLKRVQGFAGIVEELRIKKLSLVTSEIIKDSSSELAKDSGYNYNVTEEIEERSDFGYIKSFTMSIDRMGNKALQILDKMVRGGHMRMMARVNKTNAEIRKVFKGIKDTEVFREKYKDGTATSGIITYTSPEFKLKEDIFKETLRRQKGKAIEKYELGLQFIKDNKLILDPRILFANETDAEGNMLYPNSGVSEAEIKAHEDRLIKHLGGNAFAIEQLQELKARLKEQIELYEIGLSDILSERPDSDDADATSKYQRRLNYYINYNSPYIAALAIDSAAAQVLSVNDYGVNKAVKHIPTIPRRYDVNRTTNYNSEIDVETSMTDNYNEDFTKIVNNEQHYKAYKYYTSRMHYLISLIPDYLNFNNNDNYVAMIDKSFIDIIKDDNLSAADEVSKRFTSIYTSDKSTATSIDRATGKTKLTLNIALINSNRAELENEVNKEIYRLIAEGKLDKETLTIEEEFEIRKGVIAELTLKKSFNLPQILELMNYQIEQYMFKAAKEDSVTAIRDIIDNARQTKVDKQGSTKKLSAKDSYINLKRQFRYYEEVFYGYDRTDDEGNITDYNREEKRTKKEVDVIKTRLEEDLQSGAINQEQYDVRMEAANDLMDTIGQRISKNQILKSVLSYVQLKGMGYNYGAAITNMFQGYFANLIESKDGRIFNTKELLSAYATMGASVSKFYTGGAINTSTAKKIHNLTTVYDLIGEVSSEIEFSKRDRENTRNWSDPYILQNSSEYFNQAPVVIATMKHVKLKHIVNGKTEEISLWDATNEEGKIREDLDIIDKDKWNVSDSEKSGQAFIDVMIRATQAINAIHGNYSKLTPTLMSSETWLRGVKQFKTWIFEATAQRFEEHSYDEALGMSRKGRWRTGFMTVTYAKAIGEDNRNVGNITKNTLYVTGQLMRRLIFLNVKGIDSKFSEVDAANIRKNISETIISIRLLIMAQALVALLSAYSDDDEADTQKALIRYNINTANRLLNDLQLFYSPEALKNMVSNILPALTLMLDVQSFVKGIYHLLTNDITTTGVYAGEQTWIRDIMKALPFTSKIHSTRAMGKQVMEGQR